MSMEISSNSKPNFYVTEDSSTKGYRRQAEYKHEMEVKDIEARYEQDSKKLIENKTAEFNNLKKDFDVKISAEGEKRETQLRALRETHEKELEQERRANDEDLMKVRIANRERIDEYKKRGIFQVESLKK